MTSDICLRPICPEDDEFLFRVYASTRQDEMDLLDWSVADKERFLRMQHAAQHGDYTTNYQAAQFHIVLAAGQPVGRLYVDRREDEIRIIDIALLPEYRNQGIGSRLLENLIDEGEECQLPLSIHVEQNNPKALALYSRLGFEHVAQAGFYILMERKPVRGRSEG